MDNMAAIFRYTMMGEGNKLDWIRESVQREVKSFEKLWTRKKK